MIFLKDLNLFVAIKITFSKNSNWLWNNDETI